MKPTRVEELYFDPEADLFMLTERELADRALALAEACYRRAEQPGALDCPAVRTALRAVHLASAFARRAEIAEAAQHAASQTEFCFCPRRIP